MQKGDMLGNLNLNKWRLGTCYTTKKSCTDGGDPTKKLNV